MKWWARSPRGAEQVAEAAAQPILQEICPHMKMPIRGEDPLRQVFGSKGCDGSKVSDQRTIARRRDRNGQPGFQIGPAIHQRNVDGLALQRCHAVVPINIRADVAANVTKFPSRASPTAQMAEELPSVS